MIKLGERVKTFRTEQNISQRLLADQTGLSATYLSRIEAGNANPSIDVLRRIARALHHTIFDFLLDEQVKAPVVRKGERLRVKTSHAPILYELLTPDLSGNLEMFCAELDSEEIELAKPTEFPTEECILVLSGTMKIQIQDDEYCLEEGDSIRFNGLYLRSLKSGSNKKLIFISAVTPPIF